MLSRKISIFLIVLLPFFLTGLVEGAVSNQGTYYEIFVRSFFDSDGDGIGDLRGIIQRLDYLNDGKPTTDDDLEVKGIWLMPILESESYHGYDVTDYYQINPDYGKLADLKELIVKAHKRGMKVLMDLPLNHTGVNHPWFRRASGFFPGKYRDYYIWAGDDTDLNERREDGSPVWHKGSAGWYYAYFWEGMPDLNYANFQVQEEMLDIARYWLGQGLDGFRLDGVKHIFSRSETNKTYQWWDRFQREMEKVKPDVYLVGEVWDNERIVAPYYNYGFDTLFNFKLAEEVIKTVQSGFSFNFSRRLDQIYDTYGQVAEEPYIDGPFLSNHDQNRVMSVFNGDWARARLAASIYLTLPGNPFLYYGEEIGMKGSKPDEEIREPMQWYSGTGNGETSWEPAVNNQGFTSVESQEMDQQSLLNHYKKLINLRNDNPVFSTGGIIFLNTGSRMVGYIRYFNEQQMIYIFHNLGQLEQTVAMEKGKTWQVLYLSAGKAWPSVNRNSELIFSVPAYSTIIIKK